MPKFPRATADEIAACFPIRKAEKFTPPALRLNYQKLWRRAAHGKRVGGEVIKLRCIRLDGNQRYTTLAWLADFGERVEAAILARDEGKITPRPELPRPVLSHRRRRRTERQRQRAIDESHTALVKMGVFK